MSDRKKEYHKYLSSEAWAKTRADILTLYNYTCQHCGKYGNHVHHKTYANLGFEEPEDLVLLCGRCHQKEHGLIKEKKKFRGKKKGKKKKRSAKNRYKRMMQIKVKQALKIEREVQEELDAVVLERIERRKKKLFEVID